ncbi:MAG: sigma-70 family RNA polymerase sigma factor [Firmicutes bacterium]|nr:sigma-70 family RNA polymerase sigma factor [Bacillota bacterium]
MITDETLYRRYLEGDESGLTALMERYGNSLTFYINGYLHDINDAEDLMIEAFAYLTVKKPPIRENFKAYLYKTARHLALRFVAKNRLRRCFGFEDLGQEPESGSLIEEVIQTEERNRILHLCMEQLNPDYREALYLVYFENMRHAQAADVMRKSEKQVADLVYRGKRSLRIRLEQEGITGAEY